MDRGPLSRGRRWGLGVVFLWFFIGSIAHFVATDIEMKIVPPYVPWPRAAVLVSGVFELLGAFGLLWAPTRRAAGIGLFLLTLAVTPCHIYMLQRPDLFASIPLWALWLRLPLQAALLALIVWSTTPARRVAAPLSYYNPLKSATGEIARSSDRGGSTRAPVAALGVTWAAATPPLVNVGVLLRASAAPGNLSHRPPMLRAR